MSVISRKITTPYSVEQMFDLVNDVKQYPDYLPWCRHAVVMLETEHIMEAELTLAEGPISKKFATRNTLTRPHEIAVDLLNGPFKKLTGCWRFKPEADGGCVVSVDMSFEFSSRLLAMVIGPVFERAVTGLINAFAKRAEVIYHEN